MSFLGRAFALGSRFLGKVAPAARFIGKYAPAALSTAGRIASDPTVNMLANRVGVNPNILRNVGAGVNNVAAGISLLPGLQQSAQGTAAAAANTGQSLAQLYNTLKGA